MRDIRSAAAGWLHAAQRVPPADRQAAVVRALRCYLATARRAVGLLVPAEPRAQGGQDGALRLEDRAQALAWLAAERVNLPAVVRQAAADSATAALATQLTAVLFRALDTHGYWHELTELNQAALAAATLTGDRAGHAQAHNDLGAAYARLRRFEPARAQLEAGLAIRRELADRPGQSASLNNLGIVYRNLHRLGEAVACFEESLALRHQLGDGAGRRGPSTTWGRWRWTGSSTRPPSPARSRAWRSSGSWRTGSWRGTS